MAAEPPLVHRPVRTGALLLVVASAQFLAVLVAAGMRTTGYSIARSSILSLGGSGSPWAWAFNASVVGLGLLGIFGLLLVWSAFDPRPSRGIGFLLLLVGAGATGAVGLFSLTSLPFRSTATTLATYVAIVGVVAGLLVLSAAMRRAERWRISRPYTLVTAAIIAVGAGLVGTGYHLGLGLGTLDWLVAGPALLWPIVEGGHIALLHRYAPGLLVKAVSA